MTKRVKWVSTIKVADKKEYQPEIPKIIKKDLIEKEVKPAKARYIVVNGIPQTVQKEIKAKSAVIKEELIREDQPYQEQKPERFEKMHFDCKVDALQDYGIVKYYQSEYGKLRIPENAIYYENSGSNYVFVVPDLLVAIQYIQDGDILWGILTLSFIFLPSAVIQLRNWAASRSKFPPLLLVSYQESRHTPSTSNPIITISYPWFG